ncbi:MAG: DUF4857 domain-containing protein, partial [Odoribacter sp.]|nr:DUF4857 domain-containing protein [Odoribacter sp.]
MTLAAKIIRLFLVLLGVMVLAMTLPELYRKYFEERPVKKLIYYSEISKNFMISEEYGDTLTHETKMVYYDQTGKQYTEREYNRQLPFLHTRKLALLGELPDSVNGIRFDQQLLKTTKRGMLMPASSFNFQLNPLFESESGKVRPEMPDDLFRINRRGIEFLDPATNKILPEKSRIFNDAMKAAGFQAPARDIYGIPSPLKSRDDGYFIIDSRGALFHLKKIKDRPYCRHIEKNITVSSMKCMVPGDLYAYIYDDRQQLHILRTDYSIKRLPIRPGNGRFVYSTNCFYKSYKNTDNDSVRLYVLNTDYDLEDYHAMETDSYAKSPVAQTEQYLFPLKIMITPGYAYVIPIFNSPGRFIWLNLFLMLVLAGIKFRNHRK